MSKANAIAAGVLILVLAAALGYFLIYKVGFEGGTKPVISSYDECVAAGFPVMESYPPQCRTDSGETFTQDIGNEIEMRDLIVVDNPRPNQAVRSPLVISGRARGTWFFEASAPVRILDEQGNLLAEKYIEAKGEWMTQDFVDFEGKISFDPAGSRKGMLILEKDNPSGLPENIQELQKPVQFE